MDGRLSVIDEGGGKARSQERMLGVVDEGRGKARRRKVDGMLGVDKGRRKVSAPRKRVYIGG